MEVAPFFPNAFKQEEFPPSPILEPMNNKIAGHCSTSDEPPELTLHDDNSNEMLPLQSHDLHITRDIKVETVDDGYSSLQIESSISHSSDPPIPFDKQSIEQPTVNNVPCESNIQVLSKKQETPMTFEGLYQLKQKGILCDVALFGDDFTENDRAIRAHGAVLAAGSTYFKELLIGSGTTLVSSMFQIIDLDTETLDVIVELLYGVHPRSAQSLQLLRTGAGVLGMDGALRYCENAMKDHKATTDGSQCHIGSEEAVNIVNNTKDIPSLPVATVEMLGGKSHQIPRRASINACFMCNLQFKVYDQLVMHVRDTHNLKLSSSLVVNTNTSRVRNANTSRVRNTNTSRVRNVKNAKNAIRRKNTLLTYQQRCKKSLINRDVKHVRSSRFSYKHCRSGVYHVCHLCNTFFTPKESELHDHLLQRHNVGQPKYNNDHNYSARKETFYRNVTLGPSKCPICKKIFSLPSSYIKHLQVVHDIRAQHMKYYQHSTINPSSVLLPKEQHSNWSCHHCGKQFHHLFQLHSHMVSSHRLDNSCPQCNRWFNTSEDVHRHVKKCDLLEETTKCDFCTTVSHSVSELNEHMALHSAFYICTHCKFQTGMKSDALDHIVNEHTCLTSKTCMICSTEFADLKTLSSHVSLHFGDISVENRIYSGLV